VKVPRLNLKTFAFTDTDKPSQTLLNPTSFYLKRFKKSKLTQYKKVPTLYFNQ